MANRTLEWIIKLVDRVSGPAAKADSALDKMTKQIENVQKAAGASSTVEKQLGAAGAKGGAAFTGEVNRELGKLFEGVAGTEGGNVLSGIFGAATGQAVGLATGVGAVVSAALVLKDVVGEVVHLFAEAISKVVELTVHLGRVAVETAAFKENTLVSMGVVLGSATKAQALFASTVRISDHLPVTTRQAVDIEKQFALAGFQDASVLKRLLVATADVKAIRGDRGVEGFLNQMLDINSVGLQSRHLRFLAQETGIREDLIFAQIRKLTGATGGDEQIEKMISMGKVSRSVGEKAILMALAGMEGGALGGLSAKLGRTFDGLVSTLKSRLFEMFTSFDSSAGFRSIKGALSNVVELLDPSKGVGAQLKAALQTAFSGIVTAVFGDLSGATGRTKLASFLGALPRDIERVGDIISDVIGSVKGFGEGFIEVAGPAISSVLRVLGISGGSGGPEVLFREIGKAFGLFAEAMLRFVHDVIVWVKLLTEPLTEAKELLQEHGFHLAPVEHTAAPPLSASLRAWGIQGGHEFHLTQHFHVKGDPKDAENLATRIDSISRRGLNEWLTEIAHGQTGAR